MYGSWAESGRVDHLHLSSKDRPIKKDTKVIQLYWIDEVLIDPTFKHSYRVDNHIRNWYNAD